MLLTIVSFIVILAILILVHEAGHFIAAKKSGMKVEEFGFGFPPRLFGIQKGETLYSINLLPFGGFVKIYGEDGAGKDDKKSFAAHSVTSRAIVLAAGVFMNLLLAWLLASASLMIGTPQIVDSSSASPSAMVEVLEVSPKSPADTAGLSLGDQIISVASSKEMLTVRTPQDLINFTAAHRGQYITINIRRDNQEKTLNAQLRSEAPPGQGILGVSLAQVEIVHYPWYQSLWNGAKITINTTGAFVMELGNLIGQAFSGKNVGAYITGPIGIAKLTGQAAHAGIVYVLQLMFLLSLNLFLLNLLPIPALDGGRLLFLAIEKIKGSPVSQKIEQRFHLIGFVVLILLMIIITIKDIIQL